MIYGIHKNDENIKIKIMIIVDEKYLQVDYILY